MFNETWVALALFSIVVGVIMRQNGLLSLSALLLTAVGAGWLWSRRALTAVSYKRSFSERRAFLGEVIDITTQVVNGKWLPVPWLKIEDECPLSVTVLDTDVQFSTKPEVGLLVNLLSLRWRERVTWHSRVRCNKRGFYPFGPSRLQSGDLFGLFSSKAECAIVDWLIVYPEVRPFSPVTLPDKEPFGDTRVRRHLFEDPSRSAGIRDYADGDPLKRIHWKASARHSGLQVKVYEPTSTLQAVIFLNMATMPKHWQGVVPELLERAVSVAASLASQAVQERYQVGLVANGCWPESDQPLRVLPNRRPEQLMHILEALAAVSVLPTISIEDLLTRESARLPWGATLIVVSGTVTEELVAVLSRLQNAGRRLVLIRLNDDALPFALPAIPVRHVVDLGSFYGLAPECME